MNNTYISTSALYGPYLAHHGTKGQKWGVRRYQNEDGTLTPEGIERYRKQLSKLERKTIDKYYRDTNKSYVLRPFRTSTGKNYDKVVDHFNNSFKNDQKYRELSRKAFDAEKARLLAEKKYSRDESKYMEFLYSAEGQELLKKSEKATRAKEKYVREKARKYIDLVKDAKLADLNIPPEYSDIARKYLDASAGGRGRYLNANGNSDFWYWDENLEYNPDNFYESWVDKEKFK